MKYFRRREDKLLTLEWSNAFAEERKDLECPMTKNTLLKVGN
jgi:hypothetical protein